MIGRTLGHYRIVDRLGSGGMGVVWLAEDLKLGRKVALKVLREDLADSPEKAARFEREARAIAALSHPSIVTLHAVEEIDGVRFLAMEHLDGRTLDQFVREGPLPVAEILRIAIPIAEALEAAHARGILHRDLKPSNVMVCTDGRVKVLDFGLAKLLEDAARPFDGKDETTLTREGQVVGTLHYSSPEQLRQETVDARTDIYSLGAVLYEMATGRVPFQGDSAAQVITAVLCDVPRRVDQFHAGVPGALADLTAQCLAKEPSSRPGTAADTARWLCNVAREDEKVVDQGRATASSRAAERKRKFDRPAQAVLAGALVLYFAASFGSEPIDRALRAPKGPVSPNLPPPTVGDVTSLVVLPISSSSSEPEYLLDGITDGVIGALGRSKDLRVISRQSAMHFKRSSKSRSEIGGELGVDLLLDVAFDRVGEEVRLRASALDAETEEVIWSTAVTRPENELSFLQEDLSSAVVDRLRSRRSSFSPPRKAEVDRIDPSAYEEYLKGRFLVERIQPGSFRAARSHFENAIELDPKFASAYVDLAEVFMLQAYGFEESNELLSRFEPTIRSALELDGKNGRAHGLLADYEKYFRWDWSAAEEGYLKAIEFSPNDPRIRRGYWGLLACLGRYAEAEAQLEAAGRMDPLNAAIPTDLAYLALFRGDYRAALGNVRRALDRDPDFAYAHIVLWAIHHYHLGRTAESDQSLAKFLVALGFGEIADDLVRDIRSGDYEDGLAKAAKRLEERSLVGRVAVGAGTMLYTAVGDLESAERWVIRAYAKRDPELVWLAQNPSWHELRERPAIQRILREMKLVPGERTETASVH